MKLTCSDLEVTESKLQLFGFYLLLVCSSACISGYLVGVGGGGAAVTPLYWALMFKVPPKLQ